MASNKRSARQRQRMSFEASTSSMDDVFAREERHQSHADAHREAALRQKACSSKNRYPTRAEAHDAILACAEHGRTGLSAYRCPYCNGWHLTSHPHKHA